MTRILLLSLLYSVLAQAQLSQSWVSGVGDDVNPCTRTAPCKTFQGALTKTVSGGQISVLDSADFASDDEEATVTGELTELLITRAITISGSRAQSELSPTVPTTSAGSITIEAGPNDVVVIRNLNINALQSGTSGITFNSGKALYIENLVVNGFTSYGVLFSPSTSAFLSIDDSSFTNNRAGGINAGTVAPAPALVSGVISKSQIIGSDRGIIGFRNVELTVNECLITDSVTDGIRVGVNLTRRSEINVENSTIVANGTGVTVRADNTTSTVRLSNSVLMNNTIQTSIHGASRIESFGNNRMVPSLNVCAQSFGGSFVGNLFAGTPFLFNNQLTNALGAISVRHLDGGLPPGISIDAGAVFGTPNTKGTYLFTNQVGSSSGCNTPVSTWTFNVLCPSQLLVPSSIPNGVTGTTYLSTSFGLDGSVGATTLILSGPLPIGLSWDAGTLFGIPSEPGNFPVQVTALDSASCMQTNMYPLIISVAPGFQGTSLSLVSDKNLVEFGQLFVLQASLDGGFADAGGLVEFAEGENTIGIGTVAMKRAVLEVTANAIGVRALRATYLGSGLSGGSRSNAINVNVVPASTRTTLALSTNQIVLGESVTITAQVASDGGTPNGTVSIVVDGINAGTPVLTQGSASILVTPSMPGPHSVVANYSGANNYASSASVNVAFTVIESDAGTPLVDAGTTDAGTTDAGTTDAGTTDAGTTDAGFTDAGGTTDGGILVDDAGTNFDSGISDDAGILDAGTDRDTDAGLMLPADAGTGAETKPNGCGCQSFDASTTLFFILLSALFRKRVLSRVI